MVENFSEWFHDILEEANITDSRYPIKENRCMDALRFPNKKIYNKFNKRSI